VNVQGWRDGALPAAGFFPVVLDDRDGGDRGGGAGGELVDERPLRRRQSRAALGLAHAQPGDRQHLQPQAAPGQRALPAPSRPQPPRAPRLKFTYLL